MSLVEGARLHLLRSLNQHDFVTGTDLGKILGMSRAAVHKHVQALVTGGVPIHRVPGKGYRLADGVTLLDGAAIEGQLSTHARPLSGEIEVLDEVDSTNAHLARTMDRSPRGRVVLAEKQTSGRGRRGRDWVTSPYRNLMMSVAVEYRQWPPHLPTLGLVTAVTIVKALESLGIQGLKLKWPNDVVQGGRKLCGVLLDVTGEAHGACRVVVGVGINVSIGDEQARDIDQQWIDIETITGRVPDRNHLAAVCLNGMLPVFDAFPVDGFATCRAEWGRLDILFDRPVAVHTADGAVVHGTARGIDESGRLQLVDDGGCSHVFTQGDVSVRVR